MLYRYSFIDSSMVEIRLSARCYPTESREKVVRAILNLFPDAVVSGDDPVVAVSHSLEHFGELLKRQKIRDAARRILRRGIKGQTTMFRLNKQVATVGKVSFSEEEHPLGDIEVCINSDDVKRTIDEIAPDTRAGGNQR